MTSMLDLSSGLDRYVGSVTRGRRESLGMQKKENCWCRACLYFSACSYTFECSIRIPSISTNNDEKWMRRSNCSWSKIPSQPQRPASRPYLKACTAAAWERRRLEGAVIWKEASWLVVPCAMGLQDLREAWKSCWWLRCNGDRDHAVICEVLVGRKEPGYLVLAEELVIVEEELQDFDFVLTFSQSWQEKSKSYCLLCWGIRMLYPSLRRPHNWQSDSRARGLQWPNINQRRHQQTVSYT